MNLKSEYIAVGVMSGTSLDGLDFSLCKFENNGDKWSYSLLDSLYLPYDNKVSAYLVEAYSCFSRRFVMIDAEFGQFIGEKLCVFLNKSNYQIDLIASHGHTVFHSPEFGYTTQIGSGARIAAETGILTYSDFRVSDVANGGQGAPLVPIGDKLLFSEYQACLNIGGFANISFDFEGKRIAYDISPANYVINFLTCSLNQKYDKDGNIGRAGNVVENILFEFNELEYYKLPYPKTLGKEWADKYMLPILDKSPHIPIEDKLRTVYEHIVFILSREIENFKINSVLLSGGGAKNKFLVELLNKKLPGRIFLPPEEIIDFKEAIIFSFLGVLRARGEVNCLSSVTGAGKDSVGGVEYLP